MENKLSVYMIKNEITEIQDIFNEGFHELYDYGDGIKAYYTPSNTTEPYWLQSFLHLRKNDIISSDARAVLLVCINFGDHQRTFALTFGRGKFLFKEGVLEEQFGLKILLNCVEKNQLRKIIKTNIGGNQKSSHEQIPKNSEIYDFGFDIHRDLLRTVSAKTDEDVFSKAMLTGGDIFSLVVDKDVTNIVDFLMVCYEKYQSNRYQENFDWLDNIKEVKSKALKESLDNILIDYINRRLFGNVWAAVPEVINWEDVCYFRYSGNRRNHFDDLYIEDILQTFENQRVNDIEQIRNKRIYAVSREDINNNIYEWSLLKLEGDGIR